MFLCKFCHKQCKNDNSQRNHQRLCCDNPEKQISSFVKYNLAKENAWNKGLSQKEYPSLARPNQKGKKFGSALTGHSEKTKQKISLKLSVNNKGGRSKWYEVAGQKVQGTWERNVAQKFEEMGISWKKLNVNIHTFEYEIDSKKRNYTPDFYLKEYNIYIEIKGYWWGNDKEKMDIVMNKYPDVKFIIIEKEQYNKIMQGELVW